MLHPAFGAAHVGGGAVGGAVLTELVRAFGALLLAPGPAPQERARPEDRSPAVDPAGELLAGQLQQQLSELQGLLSQPLGLVLLLSAAVGTGGAVGFALGVLATWAFWSRGTPVLPSPPPRRAHGRPRPVLG